PETNIEFFLVKPAQVRITVYNVRGQMVRVLTEGYYEQGVHNVLWDGKTESGSRAGSGMYFYNMKSGDYTSTKKMILLK
ncbi:MAG: T9SS type A sorting domain-containing protein, partial [Candidatus Cloacimonetes bacterium]|nr:T9SS type A sorting domain-containing protein [Candidatus Cloacimonadota bacterium]